MSDQQGRYVQYGTGAQTPQQYGANDKRQQDLAWGRVQITGGALAAQSGRGSWGVDVDGRLIFTPDPAFGNTTYYSSIAINQPSGAPPLLLATAIRAVDRATYVFVDPIGTEVLVAAILDAEITAHIYTMA